MHRQSCSSPEMSLALAGWLAGPGLGAGSPHLGTLPRLPVSSSCFILFPASLRRARTARLSPPHLCRAVQGSRAGGTGRRGVFSSCRSIVFPWEAAGRGSWGCCARQCPSLDGAGACLRSLGWVWLSQPAAQALFLLGVTQVEQPEIKHAPSKGSRQCSPAGSGAWCSPARAMAERWLLPLACLAASLLPPARSARGGPGEAPWGGSSRPARRGFPSSVPGPVTGSAGVAWGILLGHPSLPAGGVGTGSVGAS